jgi:hypothetical protein
MAKPSLERVRASHKAAGEALALLYRPITEDERLEAARALGMEHALPEPEQLPLTPKEGPYA